MLGVGDAALQVGVAQLYDLHRISSVVSCGGFSLQDLSHQLAGRARFTAAGLELRLRFADVPCQLLPVEFARGAEQATLALDSAVAKIWADLPEQASAPAADPLGRLKSVIAATADLRSESGRLSARKVAEAMGLALSQLAAAIGKPRQSIWKTDDAEAIQERLLPFERIARLRAVLSMRDFRSWLNMANKQLDSRTPIDLLRGGHADVVADLAEDMLTGSPV